ncbi:conserved hypothetical protein [Neospora caninum Liverpool]|uniref:Transmembrane protein n=1 Tax=Neospora caninum (strain Liverpool) TaxID=572307 RepID=F0VAG7_NEOCL|nr:conserved hypothetical protein [Neospora caninum Liverpool]CBZ50656.1 conserved hypothetical protein [Neospora caninum Liverpool]|eukprot:XP_003880689.1 conserved hypothetical protein [Neospora caninum Liverpool]
MASSPCVSPPFSPSLRFLPPVFLVALPRFCIVACLLAATGLSRAQSSCAFLAPSLPAALSPLFLSGVFPTLLRAGAVFEEYAELDETGEQSHHRRKRIDPSLPHFEARSAVSVGADGGKSLFSWDSYHSRVLTCEACQCLSRLVLERLNGNEEGSHTETGSEDGARTGTESEGGKGGKPEQGEGERQTAQNRKEGTDESPRRERQSEAAAGKESGPASERERRESAKNHRGGGAEAGDRNSTEVRKERTRTTPEEKGKQRKKSDDALNGLSQSTRPWSRTTFARLATGNRMQVRQRETETQGKRNED